MLALPAVAVSVTAPAVGPLHTARPFVWSAALLIAMCTGSGFVQLAFTRIASAGTAQSALGSTSANVVSAVNCAWFPGAAAAESAVAVAGPTLSTAVVAQFGLPPPQPASNTALANSPTFVTVRSMPENVAQPVMHRHPLLVA